MRVAVIAGSLLVLPAKDTWAAYQARCNGGPIANVTINSVLGEPRDLEPDPMVRFHSGADIANCNSLSTVQPIAGGTVRIPTVCIAPYSTCVRVTDSTGRSFDYEHLTNITVSTGDTVTTATTLGQVISGQVLHLQEVHRTGSLAYRYNPQRTNALSFNPVDVPAYSTTTVGPIAEEEIILVSEYGDEFGRPQADGYQSSPSTFQWRSNIFYVRGKVDVLLSARGGTRRKGVYVAGFDISPSFGRDFRYDITFNAIPDRGTFLPDFRSIYWARDLSGFTYFATNMLQNAYVPWGEVGTGTDSTWNTGSYTGPATICGYIQSFPQGPTRSHCVNAYVDNSAPTIAMSNAGGTVADGGATSTATITIAPTDSGGIYSITVAGGVSYSSTNYPSGVDTAPSITFPTSGVLTDGQYTATVVDLAGNSAQATFRVDTAGPSGSGNLTQAGLSIPADVIFPSTTTTGSKWTDSSGVSTVATAGTVSTFSCVSNMISTVAISQMLSLSSGTYTSTATTCAGVTSTATFTVTTGTRTIEVCVPGNCSGTPANGAAEPTSVTIIGQPLGAPDCSGYPSTLACFCDVAVLAPHDPGDCVFTGSEYQRKYTAPCSQPFEFTVSNSTDISWNLIMRVNGTGYGNNAGLDSAFPTPGNSVAGELHVPQTGAVCPSTSTATPGVSIWSKFWNLVLAAVSMVDDYLEAANKAGKGAFPGSTVSGTGSSVALSEGATIRYSLAWPSGMSISTQTLAIYQWDGAAWSSATVGGQYIYKDPTTSVLTASGTITYSGIYGLFYDAVDSSAPTTTLSFQGSTRSFLTDVFVATDAYVVLIATDPTVNGYASNVATTYYRIDPTTSSPAFSVYTTSVPLSLGFHIFEYRTVDWAGNYEPIKTSTFLVTAGTLFRASSRLSSRGSGLMGFLDYGVLLDVQSRAENSLTLQISSPNATPLLSADNIGDIGLGLSQMSARFDVQGGTPTLAALALRSGNSIASTSSVQIAFGYNGEASMRHALTTTHSTDTVGNRMDFYVWNPLAPSTSSIAAMDVLALQASTTSSGGVFHVRPVGNPIGGVELIVSDGVTPGAGTVLRADAKSHSSRAPKSDIRPLTPQERATAYKDALTLKHARFNYKSEPQSARPHIGVMHEDAPDSIRGPGGSVSLDARLLNLEVALQETAQRLKRLRERVRRLENP